MTKPPTPRLHSIALRLFGGIAGCVLLLLVAVYLLNTLVLKDYYIGEKQERVSATFTVINEVCEDTEELRDCLIDLQDNGTVDIVLWTGRQLLYYRKFCSYGTPYKRHAELPCYNVIAGYHRQF